MYLAILKVNNKNIFGYLQILDVYKKSSDVTYFNSRNLTWHGLIVRRKRDAVLQNIDRYE